LPEPQYFPQNPPGNHPVNHKNTQNPSQSYTSKMLISSTPSDKIKIETKTEIL
jgi:hypothetical protein